MRPKSALKRSNRSPSPNKVNFNQRNNQIKQYDRQAPPVTVRRPSSYQSKSVPITNRELVQSNRREDRLPSSRVPSHLRQEHDSRLRSPRSTSLRQKSRQGSTVWTRDAKSRSPTIPSYPIPRYGEPGIDGLPRGYIPRIVRDELRNSQSTTKPPTQSRKLSPVSNRTRSPVNGTSGRNVWVR